MPIVREFKTPKEITIVLNGRDGWTIPQIAEVSRISADALSSELDSWDGITGRAAAEAVKAVRQWLPAAHSNPGRENA